PQAVRVRALEVPLHALGAEHAAVEREVLPRLEADHLVAGDLELDAALLAAEAAMCLDELVGRFLGAAARAGREVRPESARDREIVDGEPGHRHSASVHSAPWASPNSARRHAGQISW